MSQISIVDKDASANFKNYKISIEADANNRIIKMTDTNGLQSDLKRDDKGNLIEVVTTRLKDKKVIQRLVRAGFDGKKTYFDLLKGRQFDCRLFYENYMFTPNFIIGGSGNPLNIKIYDENNILTFDADYAYTYNADGYWLTQDFTNKVNGVKSSNVTTFLDCN